MITNIILYNTTIHYKISIPRNRIRPYWVSSGECKRQTIIKMLNKQQISYCVQKNDAIQNNTIQQYLYQEGLI